jgi:hypothetical protein
VVLIADLEEAVPLLENPYTELRRRLLAAHQLTDFQLVEQPQSATSRLPEAVRALHLGLCPRGQENNAFFHCFFLNKLPRELRVLLIEADIANKRCVVHQGGLLFAAHNCKLSHDMGAAVAAVSLQDCEGEKELHGGGSSSRGWQQSERQRERTARRGEPAGVKEIQTRWRQR